MQECVRNVKIWLKSPRRNWGPLMIGSRAWGGTGSVKDRLRSRGRGKELVGMDNEG